MAAEVWVAAKTCCDYKTRSNLAKKLGGGYKPHITEMPVKRKTLQHHAVEGDDAVAAICSVVRRIPKGWVATYGQVAAMAGLPGRARLVGYVLGHLDPAITIPWHRVVNAKGEVSYDLSRNGGDALQRHLLEQEGIEFDAKGRFKLEKFRWLD